ncbi:MAG: FHA domain-containing protein [Planctomycetota bacterium]
MTRPRLDILSGELSGRSYTLEEDTFVIGRSRSCDLVIPKRYVSRQHARIVREGRDFVIDGLSEKNPIVVEDQPIREHLLQDGDEFELCGIRFRFRVPVPGEAPPVQQTQHSGSGVGWQEDTEGGFGRKGGRGRPKQKDAQDSWRDEPPRQQGGWDEDSAGAPPRDDSWEDEAAGGWRDDSRARGAPAPAYGSPPPLTVRGGQEDSWQDARGGKQLDEDSWQAEPRGAVGGAVDDDSWADEGGGGGKGGGGTGGGKGRQTGRGQQASRAGQVVFEVEESDDPREQTGAVAAKKLQQLSSRGSGSGVRESDGERTAELGKALDPDDPDYDPFKELESQKAKEKVTDPAKEKTLRLLSVVGLLGIVLAVVIQQRIKDKGPTIIEKVPEAIRLRVGQSSLFTVGWVKADPPRSTTMTKLDGEPTDRDYYNPDDPIARVEWMLPILESRSLFLIRAMAEGTTEFRVEFPESNKIKVWTIEVEGLDPHVQDRDKHKAECAKKPARVLDREAREAFASGERYRADRELPHKEGYYRAAYLRFSEAYDAAEALSSIEGKSGGTSKATRALLLSCEDNEQKALSEWEEFVRRQFETYKAMVHHNDPREDQVRQLQRTLRAISHSCDVRYRRLHAILTELHRQPLKGGTKCQHDTD